MARPTTAVSPLEAAKNFGPITAAELAQVGLRTAAQLRALGAEEVCRRWVLAFPERLHLTAIHAVIGAIEDRPWNQLDEGQRAAARTIKATLALELGRGVRAPARRDRRSADR